MNTGYLPLKSEQLDEHEDAEILALLQSSDAESSSDDDLTPPSNKKVLQDPVPGDASVWKATVNLINYIEAVGFLALPYALKEGGIVAIVAFLIIPIILWYMGTILVECLYDEDDRGRKIRARSDYKDLGNVLLPKWGGYIAFGVVSYDIFLTSVSYLVLCGSVMHHAFPSVPITEVMWICIAGGLVLPTTFLKSLTHIAWLSVFSMLALVAVVVAVVWYGAEHTNEWDLGTNILFWDAEGMVMSLSIIMYSYDAFVIIPSVEKSMAEKTKFSCALGLANGFSLIMKLSFSVCAYLSFGVNTKEVILNNLPPGPVHITVSSCFAFSCIFSYVLILFPLFESCQNSLTKRIQNDKIPSFLTNAVIRVTVVPLTVVVAIFVPNFFIMVSFIGSSTGFVFYVFPFVLHLKLKYKQLKIHQVFIDCFLVFFGVILTIVGTGVSFKTLIDFYKQ